MQESCISQQAPSPEEEEAAEARVRAVCIMMLPSAARRSRLRTSENMRILVLHQVTLDSEEEKTPTTSGVSVSLRSCPARQYHLFLCVGVLRRKLPLASGNLQQ